MKHQPYDYQKTVFDSVIKEITSGTRSIICQMPTRSGKSIIATMLIEYFYGEPIYFVGHTKILIDQMSDELYENDIKHGIISPHSPQLRYRVQVISKDTMFNRFKQMKNTGWKEPKLIIVDECHIAMSKRYREILDSYPNSILIGLSATPIRLDGKGLNEIFDKIIQGPSIAELQRKKRLCQIDTFAVDFDDSGMHTRHGEYIAGEIAERVEKPAVLSNIVRHWEKIAKGEKTLTFCASIKHSTEMAEAFTTAGYPSISISSKDGKQGIKEKLESYYSGRYINLCSVDLFIMGFTVKECSCVIQARPTQSLMIYLQSIGRGTIWLPDKVLKNIDAVNNYTRHGLPEDDREWPLSGSSAQKEPRKLKKCPSCLRPVPIRTRRCDWCGHMWTETAGGSRIPEEKDGRLIKIERNIAAVEVARRARTFEEAQAIAGDQAEYIWFHVLKNMA